ncbi:MAG: GTPase RsgA, partial [Bacteroidaceae bacterium]|nr:GTPase RsgA [Bacteroidaceae bacterium]
MAQGIVVRSTGSWYTVKTDEGAVVDCKVKGKFRLRGIRSTNPVAVGDRVHITVADDGSAFITEVEERRNYIVRRASNLSKESHIIAANLDAAVLVVTVEHPRTNLVFIDRFLATAEAYAVPV